MKYKLDFNGDAYVIKVIKAGYTKDWSDGIVKFGIGKETVLLGSYDAILINKPDFFVKCEDTIEVLEIRDTEAKIRIGNNSHIVKAGDEIRIIPEWPKTYLN